jgi:menaquinone-dependent protoporphyrinogen oxidase
MAMKVLVSAASKHGSTQEVAELIAVQLRGRGHEVKTTPPQDVRDVEGVDVVLLGSAVYMGQWMKPARELAARLASDLARRPVWLFSCGPLGEPPAPDPEGVDVSDLVQRTGARGHRVFTGRLDRSSLSFAERAVVHAVHAPYGDFVDDDAVRAWADEVADTLTSAGVAR